MTITSEHLELAALAAGKRVVVLAVGRSDFDALDLDANAAWRPHLDEGETARLAVRLGIITQPQMSVAVVHAWMTGWTHQGERAHVRHDGTEPDKLRAWREAVTLCAAAVGAKMKGGA